MKRKYVEIFDNKVCLYDVDFPISPMIRIKPFERKLENIVLVGICVRMLGDDEVYFIVLIDNKQKIFPIGDNYLHGSIDNDFFSKLDNLLQIKDYRHLLSDFHFDSKQTSFVVYPEKLFGKPLYEENFSGIIPFFHSIFRSTLIKKLGTGILTDECSRYLMNPNLSKYVIKNRN